MKSGKLKTTIILSVLLTITMTQASLAQETFSKYAHPEMKKMEFMIGKWQFNAKFKRQDGSFGKITSRSIVNTTLGGRAIADHYCNVLSNGEIDNVGVTIRSYNPRLQKWLMVFYDLDLGSRTEFTGEFKDGEFHFEGTGLHNGIALLEKVTFYNIEKDGYSWKMDRSYDNGKTWIKDFFSYEAVRLK
ncbi:MAG: hypothetical protein HEP71_19275 [Roseivirga sp.]|nr:hypothetical protein [Roseivirga sp.]